MPAASKPPRKSCEEADNALSMAIFSIFCLGIILAPIALSKASKAERLIVEDLELEGMGKVKAARIIATISLGLWVLGVIARLSEW